MNWCMVEDCLCPYANERGYCSITGCRKPRGNVYYDASSGTWRDE